MHPQRINEPAGAAMKDPFELERLTHAALAQYHRWYQVYEAPFTDTRIANQKDILSDDVEIVSQAGTSKGKSGLEDRLKAYTGWQNAHHVQNTAVVLLADGQLQLEADIVYQNIRPDDSQFSYTLHYSTRLQPRPDDLPVFTRLELKPTGEIKDFKFEAAYAENRCKSFMHYWLYLLESPQPKASKFRELLADEFALQPGDGETITDLSAFEPWLAAMPERMSASTHACKNFRATDEGNGVLKFSVDLDVKTISPAGESMAGQTHYECVLVNDVDERFARVKSMEARWLQPLQKALSTALC
jgi:hypothetical protein